jgi:asparagine synthase (glutamine-hydrolysing)
LVAAAFGSTHHELAVDPSHVAADLPAIVGRFDQPTLDAVNSFYVSRAVAATGIKAVLSGAGGDELFGGYPSFRRLPGAVRWKGRLQPLASVFGPVVASALPERLVEPWRHFMSGNGGNPGNIASAYRAQRGLFMPAILERLAGPALRDCWVPATERLATAESALLNGSATTLEGDVARLETRVYLGSQLLRDLDAMSMAHSLEVRVPFVDHLLLDAVWPDLGAYPSLMRNKQLLHETLALPLPRAAVDRPKQGFTLPFARWMREDGELVSFVRGGMRHLADEGWIARDVPDATWRSWQQGAMHWSRPWALGVLGEFLRSA